ncbi:hypothetical protein ACEWY4_012439 [Coilia grayii]|uniref:AIG1-type G domain-containing protein n=1 Tax=Coilia grayii TaxID=363190 RepID=A0ABD1K0P0_9TELE
MVQVIDTPGLFDTSVSNEKIREEIGKCIAMASPGPHVFLLLVALGHFTQEKRDTVKMIQETFGEYSKAFTMVGFTREISKLKLSVERKFRNLCGEREEEVKRLEELEAYLETNHGKKIKEIDDRVFADLARSRNGIHRRAEKAEAEAVAKTIQLNKQKCTIS